jgi:hypothetical protein
MSLVISGFALLVSILSVVFAVLSWREAHRPIVIARVTTAASGNVTTALRLLVENVGNRPARDIALTCEKALLDTVLDPNVQAELPEDVARVFASDTVVPILEHGRQITCAFGQFSAQESSTWVPNSRLSISVSYKSLGRRRFKESMTLLLADDHSFTGLQWADPQASAQSG